MRVGGSVSSLAIKENFQDVCHLGRYDNEVYFLGNNSSVTFC